MIARAEERSSDGLHHSKGEHLAYVLECLGEMSARGKKRFSQRKKSQSRKKKCATPRVQEARSCTGSRPKLAAVVGRTYDKLLQIAASCQLDLTRPGTVMPVELQFVASHTPTGKNEWSGKV